MLKTVSSITNAIGALNYKGTWNAATNNPSLSDGTGAKGDYYVVSTPGTQTFDGIQYSFGIGDWIVYNGAVWQRVEGGADGNFTNVTASGFVGTAATGALKMPVGTTGERPTPASGMIRMNSTTGYAEYYDGSKWVPITTPSVVAVEYLTIAGGGGGGGGADLGSNRGAGGAGAGGYLTSTTQIVAGANYTVTVGAGGAAGTLSGASPGGQGGAGGNSVFGAITSTGGGGGGGAGSGSGANGGSGGGGGAIAGAIGTGTAGQGNNGGTAAENAGGGGGGATALGGNASASTGGTGGAGTASSITGSSVTRAGGGGGGASGTGGSGGGGNGGAAGTANTGGGGGGGFTSVGAGAGGSGIVILKYPSSYTLTIGAGLTASTATSGAFKVTSFTAGTDTISFGV